MAIQIDRAEVRRVAALAHLALSEDEERRLAGELTSILGYVEKLRALDTEAVPPTSAVAAAVPPREDQVRPSLSAEAATQNAPASLGGAFLVPKIME